MSVLLCPAALLSPFSWLWTSAFCLSKEHLRNANVLQMENVLSCYGYSLYFCGDQRIWQHYTVMTLFQLWAFKKSLKMLPGMDIVYSLPTAVPINEQLVRGRAQITGILAMFVFSMHFSERIRIFWREIRVFSFSLLNKASSSVS